MMQMRKRARSPWMWKGVLSPRIGVLSRVSLWVLTVRSANR
jgi:hypothetical protein